MIAAFILGLIVMNTSAAAVAEENLYQTRDSPLFSDSTAIQGRDSSKCRLKGDFCIGWGDAKCCEGLYCECERIVYGTCAGSSCRVNPQWKNNEQRTMTSWSLLGVLVLMARTLQ